MVGDEVTAKPPKPKKCKAKGCGIVFTPQRMGQHVCGPACAQTIAMAKREQEEQRKRSDERKADRVKREKLKTRSDWMKEAQREFNRYIRLRDASRLCICCSKPLGEDEPGGGYDAGHFRSVGSAPHLRFDERNVHAQRKYCNKYLSGNALAYRVGLINRIGLGAVESLESDQTPRRYTIEDLKQIRDTYRQKARELEKETA